jgi:hypothetical protein
VNGQLFNQLLLRLPQFLSHNQLVGLFLDQLFGKSHQPLLHPHQLLSPNQLLIQLHLLRSL